MLLKNDLWMWNEPVEVACEVYEVRLIFCSYPNNTGKNKPLRKGYIIEAYTVCVNSVYHDILLQLLSLFLNFAFLWWAFIVC